MIVFGLGNPGLKYRYTRHNAGYIFLDSIAKKYQKRFRDKRGFKIARIAIGKEQITLVKPVCWMNDSGSAVQAFLYEHEDDFLVVLDDVNLALGRIRLRKKGSDGGHLGLRSIITTMQDQNFPRLRIGVGRSENDIIEHVLSSFSREEMRVLRSVIKLSIPGFILLLTQSFNQAQNHINAVDLSGNSKLA